MIDKDNKPARSRPSWGKVNDHGFINVAGGLANAVVVLEIDVTT